MHEQDNKFFTIRMKPNTHDELKKLADKEDRSLSNYINIILKQHAQQQTQVQ